ncbi:MAG: aminopeptidase [Bacillota bacterium]|nr:aminopeptidase [Bacillota bacterium]
MIHPMLEKYARVLVNYSLGLKKGDTFLIQGAMLSEPLIKAVYKEAIIAGAHPIVITKFEGQDTIFYKHASEEQLNYESPFTRYLYEKADALLNILGSYNTKTMTSVDPEKIMKRNLAATELREIFYQRAAAGELRWNICQFPTLADAQEASMSLEEYEDFVFQACHLDKDDPVKYWQEFGEKLKKIADYLNNVEELHFLSEDTDLRCRVKDRIWVADRGKENYPGGEVFTAPIEDSVEGEIRFSFPGIFQGKEIEDIRLTFEKGKVVKASAAKGEELLHALLKTDEGACYVGEVAIGCNYGITRFTRNMLYDEKIGGTIHLAIGSSYPETGGKNKSTIHWDMLCDMKKGGLIYADGKKIYENGEFLI